MKIFKFKLNVFFNFKVKDLNLSLKLNVLKLTLIINCVSYFFIRKLNKFVCKIKNFAEFFFN